MNLPNKLTISRILLTPFFMFFLFAKGVTGKSVALIIFLIAASTDLLDGFIAKRTNQITDFGKLMDPIADKILIISAFLAFVEMELVPAWMVVIIVFREVAVTGLRIFALTKRVIIPSDDGGRHKTASQSIAVFVILLFLIFREAGIRASRFWDHNTEALYKNAIFALMLITVTLTLISGISYLIKNRRVYLNAKTD